jgi:hypothetical protein
LELSYPVPDNSSIAPDMSMDSIVTDLIDALPGNRSVNTVQHATIKEATFSADLMEAPID